VSPRGIGARCDQGLAAEATGAAGAAGQAGGGAGGYAGCADTNGVAPLRALGGPAGGGAPAKGNAGCATCAYRGRVTVSPDSSSGSFGGMRRLPGGFAASVIGRRYHVGSPVCHAWARHARVDCRANPMQPATSPPTIPGYDLLDVLGTGAMGVVWRAREHRLDRLVALKVHAGAVTPAIAMEMWSEARLTANLAHPGIVAVHDFGETLEGRPFYTMDLVAGTDLAALLKEGPLPLPRALALAAEIARAVGAAHERGIVHRDLKPRNVLVDPDGHARILDFGIALSLAHAQPEASEQIVGTPPYMSPEHLRGDPTGTTTDVYALGVILFEMLTGRRPFIARPVSALVEEIMHAPPPAPTSIDPAIPLDVERVCLRCLDKRAEGRYASARALAEALAAILEGRPLPDAAPREPARLRAEPGPTAATRPPKDAPIHVSRSFTLASSPAALWPHVANTDRFNKAIGVSPVDYSLDPLPEGGSARTGSFRVLMMDVTWHEHPFEWVAGREHSVHRSYRAGPLAAFWNQVRLDPAPGGGTVLTHTIWAVPTGRLAGLAAGFEIRGAVSGMEAVYRKLDESAASEPAPASDPFEPPHRPTRAQRERVAAGLASLDRIGVERELSAPLAEVLLHAPDKALETLRPFSLADAWGQSRDDVLELCLVAAHAGLLDIAWDLVCPVCLVAHERVGSLAGVRRTGVCESCNDPAFERDLARTVELVFRPHAAVRDVSPARYCAGSPAMRPHILAQQVLAPGEARRVAIDLPRGTFRLVARGAGAPADLVVSPLGHAAAAHVTLAPGRLDVTPAIVRAGEVALTLENTVGEERVLRLEASMVREDAVTATIALAHPAFQELFSEELLAPGEHVTVSRMAFLWFTIDGVAELSARHGEPRALAMLGEVDRLAREATGAHGGALLDGALAGTARAIFPSAGVAALAGLRLQASLAALPEAPRVRAAAHEGRCLALRHGARTEFFGETLERGAALLSDAALGSVAISSAVAEDREALASARAMGARFDVVTSAAGRYAGRRVVLVSPAITSRA
jgi:serine/threonine protein kinase